MFTLSQEQAARPGRAFTEAGTVNRTLVTAYLLTGRIDRAEKPSREAVADWNPDIERGEALFRRVVTSALRNWRRRDANGLNRAREDVAYAYLPAELQAGLDLKAALRQSFVLHLLIGFSRDECAGPLGSSVE